MKTEIGMKGSIILPVHEWKKSGIKGEWISYQVIHFSPHPEMLHYCRNSMRRS
jgi:hypothetical protein